MSAPLIALSGIDGSGKTTQAARLVSWLQESYPGTEGVKARLTALQGIFALSEDLFGDPYDYHPRIPASLREFTIACDLLAWSRDTLEPLLTQGSPVVWDRSPLCYETYARCYGADMTWPRQLLSLVRQPDLIILLDLQADASVRRVQARAHQPLQTDEDAVLLSKARATYLDLAKERANVVIVDADQHPDEVAALLQRLVIEHLAL
jgi:dTMP kinase